MGAGSYAGISLVAAIALRLLLLLRFFSVSPSAAKRNFYRSTCIIQYVDLGRTLGVVQ